MTGFKAIALISPILLVMITTLRRRRRLRARKEELIHGRQSAKCQTLSHSHDPLVVVRGEGSYLIDELGRRFLDSRNNVASIGHQHPTWVEAVCKQLALTNTNARYLHPLRNQLVHELCETLPSSLCV